MKNLLIVLSILVVGCADYKPPTFDHNFKEIHTESGMKCIYFIVGTKGGLTCDWKNYCNE